MRAEQSLFGCKLRTIPRSVFMSGLFFLLMGAMSRPLAAQPFADSIYHGPTILTMDERQPSVSAVALRGERIVAVGSLESLHGWRGPSTRMFELEPSQIMIPGMIDAHGHLSGLAASLASVDLSSPPVGQVTSIEDLQETLRRALAERPLAEGEWLTGRGYDDSLLREQRHPNRHDLDAVSTRHPIALTHVSGHLMACNSLALERAGIHRERKDPDGGAIRRVGDSLEPNGVLEETAAGLVRQKMSPSQTAGPEELLARAQSIYASYGITTAQDGASSRARVENLTTFAREHPLSLDVVSYVTPAGYDSSAELLPPGGYQSRLKLGGIKLFLDGSPQGKTAYLTLPYWRPPEGKPVEYRGYPTLSGERLHRTIGDYYLRRVQIIAHANGDAAIDELLSGVEAAIEAHGMRDHRTVVIHAQTARHDQLVRMQELGVIPSFFVAHTFFWGDWHRDSVLGPDRAFRISPTRSAEKIGLRFTLHNDAPVVPPDMIRLLWTAVHRRTRSGQVLGEEERIDVVSAIRSVTSDAAWQHFDEEEKGSITVGKYGDLVILSHDPRRLKAEDWPALHVVETIHHGKTSYRRKD